MAILLSRIVKLINPRACAHDLKYGTTGWKDVRKREAEAAAKILENPADQKLFKTVSVTQWESHVLTR